MKTEMSKLKSKDKKRLKETEQEVSVVFFSLCKDCGRTTKGTARYRGNTERRRERSRINI